MSSGTVSRSQHDYIYLWSDALDHSDYLFAHYRVSSELAGEDTAIAMAMEQSAATPRIVGFVEPEQLAAMTIRVVTVEKCPSRVRESLVERYHLQTQVYGQRGDNDIGSYQICLAIPHALLLNKPAQFFNIVLGELPRLGFLASFVLTDIASERPIGPGPGFGRDRLRALFGNSRESTLLCRSMRPAVGLSSETMARLNREVLEGGFHGVKDDELIAFASNECFARHVAAMIQARDLAAAATGEKKFYVANLICEPDELEARWMIALEYGVDAVLVAPHLQGFGVLAMLARRRRLPILAHNTLGELLTRHPSWSIDEAVMCKLLRFFGADWFVTPGAFGMVTGDRDLAARVLASGGNSQTDLAPMMPILQGGKHPEGLSEYRQAVGGQPMMLIVASWVDNHPAGIRRAASLFREAVSAFT